MEIIYENYIYEVYRELDNISNKYNLSTKDIILFGAGLPSQIEYDYFREKNIKVLGMVDNSKIKQGTKYKECIVYSPEEMLGKYNENAYIIIASAYYKEMERQLVDMGYSESQIYLLKSFNIENTKQFPFEEGYEYTEMNLREIQLRTFEILKYVKKFCEESNIRFYIAYGSLLGAVRHQGFIPWDDDIDILMPWEDYVRFCDEFTYNDEYKLYARTGKENGMYTIAKVMDINTVSESFNFPVHNRAHLCIDIFPMSGYPQSDDLIKKYDLELKDCGARWSKDVYVHIGTNMHSENMCKNVWRELEKVMTRYNYNKSQYVGSVACAPYSHSIAPIEKYGTPSEVIFEGEKFPAPSDYDYILRETYGDYMKLPPIEQRNPRHFYKTYKVTKK